MSLIESQFEMIDRMDHESQSFNFGDIDLDESMRVDMDDYSAIMFQKKNSMDSWKSATSTKPASIATPGGPAVTPGGDESNEPRNLE